MMMLQYSDQQIRHDKYRLLQKSNLKKSYSFHNSESEDNSLIMCRYSFESIDYSHHHSWKCRSIYIVSRYHFIYIQLFSTFRPRTIETQSITFYPFARRTVLGLKKISWQSELDTALDGTATNKKSTKRPSRMVIVSFVSHYARAR